MTKHVIKESTCLTLAILIALIALAIPVLGACGASDASVSDNSGMEQNRSRAPSSAEYALLDLPEDLLDLDDTRIGRGIDQEYIDTEDSSDSNTQINLQLYSNENSDLPSDSLLNAARNEGDEQAKQIIENEVMWNLINNSDEAEAYFGNLHEQENQINEPKPATRATTAPTSKATTPATQPATSKAAPTTTAPTTATPTTATPTTAVATTTTAPVTNAPAAPAASGKFLLSISNPDPNYVGRAVQVQDRAVLEGLVMGEFGNDYIGAVLVAQAIRDTMTLTGVYNTAQIARQWGYTARIHSSVSDATKRAVAFVFDQGGSAVQHSIYYFYASHLTYSSWHETQRFVVQYGGCRFFSRW